MQTLWIFVNLKALGNEGLDATGQSRMIRDLQGGDPHSCTIPIPDDQGYHRKKSSSVIDSIPLDLHTAARWVDTAECKLMKRMKRKTEQATLVEKQKTLVRVNVPAAFYQTMQFLDTFDPAVILHSVPRTSKPLERRQAVRQCYTRQKKMAIMDSKALNEICRELRRADYSFTCWLGVFIYHAQEIANLSSICSAICIDHHGQRLNESITVWYFILWFSSCHGTVSGPAARADLPL